MSKKQFTLEIDSIKRVAKSNPYYSSDKTEDIDVTAAEIYEAISKFLLEKEFITSVVKVESKEDK